MEAQDYDLNHIRLTDRPLIVCDIDEVVLEFISPFAAFLRSQDHELLPRSFHLHGNIVSTLDGSFPEAAVVSSFLDAFFAAQDKWQMPAEQAVETLHRLAGDADIVFLTAMSPRHRIVRRGLLDRFDLHFPMVATEGPKGPVVTALHRARPLPVAFIDDIERNLLSVREHVPDCLLLTMIANADFRALAPQPCAGIRTVTGWAEAFGLLQAHVCHDNRSQPG